MDAELQKESPVSPSRWRGDVGILVCFIGGLLLAINAPFWFKPPYTAIASWIYLALFLVWIPIYIIRRVNHPRGDVTILVVVLGTMVNCCLCRFLAPRPMETAAFGLAPYNPVQCQSVPVEGNRVRYECIHIPFFDGAAYDETLTLEGYDWLPIVWKVRD